MASFYPGLSSWHELHPLQLHHTVLCQQADAAGSVGTLLARAEGMGCPKGPSSCSSTNTHPLPPTPSIAKSRWVCHGFVFQLEDFTLLFHLALMKSEVSSPRSHTHTFQASLLKDCPYPKLSQNQY